MICLVSSERGRGGGGVGAAASPPSQGKIIFGPLSLTTTPHHTAACRSPRAETASPGEKATDAIGVECGEPPGTKGALEAERQKWRASLQAQKKQEVEGPLLIKKAKGGIFLSDAFPVRMTTS